jgi:uncharacterized protein YhhL (DUF1145 family)
MEDRMDEESIAMCTLQLSEDVLLASVIPFPRTIFIPVSVMPAFSVLVVVLQTVRVLAVVEPRSYE